MPHFTPSPQGRARTTGTSPVDATSLNIQNNLEVSPAESVRTAGGRARVGPVVEAVWWPVCRHPELLEPGSGASVPAAGRAEAAQPQRSQPSVSSRGSTGGFSPACGASSHRTQTRSQPDSPGLPACPGSQLRGRLPGISGGVLLLNWALSVQRAAVTCGTGLWCQYEPSIVQLGTHNALGQLFIYKSTQRSPQPLHSTLSQNANWLLPVSQTGLLS